MITRMVDLDPHVDALEDLHRRYQCHTVYAHSRAKLTRFYLDLLQHPHNALFGVYLNDELKGVLGCRFLKDQVNVQVHMLFDPRCPYDKLMEIWTTFLADQSASFSQLKVTGLKTDCLQTESNLKMALKDLGFILTDQQLFSRYDYSHSLSSTFTSLHQKLDQEYAFDLLDYQAFQTLPNWQNQWYQLQIATMTDIPSKVPIQPLAFDVWKTYILDRITPDHFLFFIAIKGELIAYLIASKVGTACFIDYTTTARVYRRLGFASLLKAKLIRSTQTQGMSVIYTRNHKKNPMLKMNLNQFGFQICARQEEYFLDLSAYKAGSTQRSR